MYRVPSTLSWATILLHLLIIPLAVQANNGARDEAAKSTIFNGEEVPPMTALRSDTYKELTSSGYWLVKAFSPYCPHCIQVAPKWQTLYEFYYTSDPLPASDDHSEDSLNTFSRYYDFNFASLDCIAFGSVCTALGVKGYPSFMLLKDGKEVKKITGNRSMKDLSKFMEECLEIIRPGSRQLGGIEVPEVGAVEFHPKHKPSTSGSGSTEKGFIKPGDPLHSPNPDGSSVKLTEDLFQERVRNTTDMWLIKFETPSCDECIHMVGTWMSMAKEMKGILNVGQVDCDRFSKLCRQLEIKGSPFVKLFWGAEGVEYWGRRGLGDLVAYAQQAVASADIKQVTKAEFEDLEKTEEVLFIYFFDQATTTEDFTVLDRLSLHIIGKAKIVKSNDKALAQRFKVLTFPHLLVARNGQRSVYDASTPQDMRNVTKAVDWMRSVWLPLVPEITVENVNQVLINKLVVVGILTQRREEQFAVAKREILGAAHEWLDRQEISQERKRQRLRDAKQLRVEEAEEKGDKHALEKAKEITIYPNDWKNKEVGFAWMDGIFWENWIRRVFRYSLRRDGEKIFILDQAGHRFWDTNSAGHKISPSRTAILDVLSQVYADPLSIPPKTTDGLLIRAINAYVLFMVMHPVFAVTAAVSFTLGGILFLMRRWLRRRFRRLGKAVYMKLPDGGDENGMLPSYNDKVD